MESGLRSFLVAFLVLAVAGTAWGEPQADPAVTVMAFNEAITTRDQKTALTQIAGGGVQFTLRALHDGVNPDKMVTPIKDHWKMVIPVLFSSTTSYIREVEVLSQESHGDVATVWTKTRTFSVRKGSNVEAKNEFTEVYLLVGTVGGWKIAAIADNREATKLAQGAK